MTMAPTSQDLVNKKLQAFEQLQAEFEASFRFVQNNIMANRFVDRPEPGEAHEVRRNVQMP